jgi:hypothetical protein
VVAPKVIGGIVFAACALLAIAYFLGWLTPGKPAPAAPQAVKATAKPQGATVQSGVVLLPGETLVAPADPVPVPAPPAAAKPAPAPTTPKYTKPKPPVVARDAPPSRQYSREERRNSYDRSTRSVCVNCGVVTSIARGDYDWEVRVRFDDGSREVLRFYDRPRVEMGDTVRLEEGRLVRD